MQQIIEEKLYQLNQLNETAHNKKILLEEMRIVSEKAFDLQEEIMSLLDAAELTERDVEAMRELFDTREAVWNTMNEIALRELEVKEKSYQKQTGCCRTDSAIKKCHCSDKETNKDVCHCSTDCTCDNNCHCHDGARCSDICTCENDSHCSHCKEDATAKFRSDTADILRQETASFSHHLPRKISIDGRIYGLKAMSEDCRSLKPIFKSCLMSASIHTICEAADNKNAITAKLRYYLVSKITPIVRDVTSPDDTDNLIDIQVRIPLTIYQNRTVVTMFQSLRIIRIKIIQDSDVILLYERQFFLSPEHNIMRHNTIDRALSYTWNPDKVFLLLAKDRFRTPTISHQLLRIDITNARYQCQSYLIQQFSTHTNISYHLFKIANIILLFY